MKGDIYVGRRIFAWWKGDTAQHGVDCDLVLWNMRPTNHGITCIREIAQVANFDEVGYFLRWLLQVGQDRLTIDVEQEALWIDAVIAVQVGIKHAAADWHRHISWCGQGRHLIFALRAAE